MEQINIIGLDLAKHSFHLHGALPDGRVAFRKKLTRKKVLPFLEEQPRSIVAMEACGSAHHWAREIGKLGHDVRLIAPIYVKGFVKRQKIERLEGTARRVAIHEATARRLQTTPGVGPVTAMAILAFAPPLEEFRRGRDFAAWLGLVPRQHSTGGKQCLGRTSKMGQRDIRTLLIIGATKIIRWARHKTAPEGSWLARMLIRKPPMLVAVALANKMARGIWAMMTRQEDYRIPATVAA
jgi:transposase